MRKNKPLEKDPTPRPKQPLAVSASTVLSIFAQELEAALCKPTVIWKTEDRSRYGGFAKPPDLESLPAWSGIYDICYEPLFVRSVLFNRKLMWEKN